MGLFFNIVASSVKLSNQAPEPEPELQSVTVTNADTLKGVWSDANGAAGRTTDATYRRSNYIPIYSRVISFEGFLYKFPIMVYDTNKTYLYTWFPMDLSGTIAVPEEAAFITFMTENHNGLQTSTDYTIVIRETTIPAARGTIYDPSNPLNLDILTEVNSFASQMTVSVSDYTGTDRERIQAAIDEVHNSGLQGTVVVEGQSVFTIDSAILIKSNVDLLIDGCKIKVGDSVFDNAIRCAGIIPDPSNPYGICSELQFTNNFKIRGINGASIEGTDVPYIGINPKTGNPAQFVADEFGWRTMLILLTGAYKYEVSGFTASKSSCYTISQEYARYGYLHDLDLYTTGVNNGDGIDLRMGCKHIIVENITGDLTDDGVAINALSGDNSWYELSNPTNYVYPIEPMGDIPINNDAVDAWIENITLNNIHIKGDNHAVIILTVKDRVRYISISNVDDVDSNSNHLAVIEAYSGYAKIGQYSPGYISNVDINGVTSYGSREVVLYSKGVFNSNISNLVQHNPTGKVYTINPQSQNVIVT